MLKLKSLVLVISVLALTATADAGEFLWVGPDATLAAWSDPSNWEEDGNEAATTPGAADDVVFDLDAESLTSALVSLGGVTQAAKSVSVVSGTVTVGTGTLTITNDLKVGETGHVNPCFIVGVLPIDFSGLSAATVTVGSDITLASGEIRVLVLSALSSARGVFTHRRCGRHSGTRL